MLSRTRLFAQAAVLAVAVLAPLSTQAAPPAKVYVCHMSGNANDVVFTPALPSLGIRAQRWEFGHVIQVSENAVDAHVRHGDSATFHPRPAPQDLSGVFWLIAELKQFPAPFGPAWTAIFEDGQFPNADCGVRYIID
jgi:hypothetical protein